eukprot:Phypoly_transcript_21650.p1 GENE.Phypoly_transcript_21650~~Phypoly_transcript_21650.p1  ORF type:complete len:182 (+),score=38.57 Phypoly_transcript_21650:42-548(+)
MSFLDVEFEVLDVGGARTERRKWIHAMQNLNEIVFLVPLSEYDLYLRETVGVNRMHESLQLFTECCSHMALSDVPFILFFTKDDLFREKIQYVSLRRCFPDFSGENEYYAARDFIISKFLGACRKKGKVTHVFVGNLTDIESMEDVVAAIKGNALYSVFTNLQKSLLI